MNHHFGLHLDLTFLDFESKAEVCRLAEDHGATSVWLCCDACGGDPLLEALVLAEETKRLRFTVGYPPKLMAPPTLVHQLNTVSAIMEGRLALMVMCGQNGEVQTAFGIAGDDTGQGDREFLEVCRAFWDAPPVDYRGRFYHIEQGRLATPFVDPDRSRPEIHVLGHPDAAGRLAAVHGDCLWVDECDWPAFSASGFANVAIGLRLVSIARGEDVNTRIARYRDCGVDRFCCSGEDTSWLEAARALAGRRRKGTGVVLGDSRLAEYNSAIPGRGGAP